jgi:RNA polymerase sigma-70 factor (ECF subfamily)
LSIVSTRFEEYLIESRPALFALALRITRDPHLAEDAVQEAVLAAYTRLDTLRDQERLHPWMRQITRNAARLVVRSRKSGVVGAMLGDLDTTIAAELEEDPALDRAEAVHDALDVLDEDDVGILMAHYDADRSTGEIAEEVGMSETGLRSRMRRARLQLLDPLVSRAITILGQAYGQSFGPRVLQRTQLTPLVEVMRDPPVVLLTTPGGRGVPVKADFEVEPFLDADLFVLDHVDLYRPQVKLVRGETVDSVDWAPALRAALDEGVPLAATRYYLDCYVMSEVAAQDLLTDIPQYAAAIRKGDAQADELSRSGLDVRGLDAAGTLEAVRSQIWAGMRDTLLGVVAAVETGGERRLEIRKAALEGFLHKHEGDAEAAAQSFRRIVRLDPAAWEWHLQLAESLVLLADAEGTGRHLVRALLQDRSGHAEVGARLNGLLRPYLAIPRLWRLLKGGGPPSMSPELSYLPTFNGILFDSQ